MSNGSGGSLKAAPEKEKGTGLQTGPFFNKVVIICLNFVDRNCLLRAILHAGQTVDAFRHVDRIGLAAFNLENRLGTNIGAGAVSITFVLVNCNHVHMLLPPERYYMTAWARIIPAPPGKSNS